MMKRWIVSILCLFAGWQAACAHEGRPIHIEVTALSADRYQLRWKIPPVLRAAEVPVVSLSGGNCRSDTGGAPSLIGTRILACEGVPEGVQLTFPEFNPALSTLVDYQPLDGGRYTLFVGPEDRLIELPGEQSFGSVAEQYLWAGFDHILEGFDHLLFVFSLLFVVGKFRRIFWVVTGFTLGHSITLGLTALYGWSLPPTFVEPLIALSIAMLAAEKLVADRSPEDEKPLVFTYPALIASLFGLLHGFGFGGALSEIGLPYGYSLTALAFFNIGVELGQVAFILVVLVAAKIAQSVLKISSDMQPAIARVFLYPAGLVAGFWTVERVATLWV